ncbi:hypothetical protein D3C72_1727940 [compost metagenome]
MQDQYAVVGVFVAFQLESTREHVAQEIFVVLAVQVQQQIIKALAGRQTVQRILARGDAVMVAEGEGVAFAVAGGRAAQRVKRVHAV